MSTIEELLEAQNWPAAIKAIDKARERDVINHKGRVSGSLLDAGEDRIDLETIV